MPYLVAAVIFATTLGLLNLSLSLAIIRRLRQEALDRSPISGPPAGTSIPEFAAVTQEGSEIRSSDLAGSAAVLAFFSTTCSACEPAVLDLSTYAQDHELKPAQVLAVISGPKAEAKPLTSKLTDWATIILEADDAPLSAAFQIQGNPSFVFADESGTITRTKVGGGPLDG